MAATRLPPDGRDDSPAVYVSVLTVGMPIPAGMFKGPLDQADAGRDGQLWDLVWVPAPGLYALVLANDCLSSHVTTSSSE